jgi:hypothetical protein
VESKSANVEAGCYPLEEPGDAYAIDEGAPSPDVEAGPPREAPTSDADSYPLAGPLAEMYERLARAEKSIVSK